MTGCNWGLPATEQEVFDIVATGLLRQGRQSVESNPRNRVIPLQCLYRGADGCKCAAGMLIPDEHYRDDFEIRAWEDLAAAGVVPDQHTQLIQDLQNIHDTRKPHYWREELIQLAVNRGLSTAPIDALAEELTL
jgi:hypothetical protein